MSNPSSPEKALLVVGVFLSDKSMLDDLLKDMENIWGEIAIISKWYDFNQTSYYEKEMGRNLVRRFIVFKDLINQDELKNIKLKSYEFEKKYSFQNKRQLNIDPGYLVMDKFVLSTGKNYSHRIYLGDGIFADLTLMYQGDGFVFFDWTYPDYKEKSVINFFLKLRNYLKFLNRHS